MQQLFHRRMFARIKTKPDAPNCSSNHTRTTPAHSTRENENGCRATVGNLAKCVCVREIVLTRTLCARTTRNTRITARTRIHPSILSCWRNVNSRVAFVKMKTDRYHSELKQIFNVCTGVKSLLQIGDTIYSRDVKVRITTTVHPEK